MTAAYCVCCGDGAVVVPVWTGESGVTTAVEGVVAESGLGGEVLGGRGWSGSVV